MSWVFDCDDYLLNQFVHEFKQFLIQIHTVDEWAKWLESVVITCLKPYESTDKYTKAAKQFLLKWSFFW